MNFSPHRKEFRNGRDSGKRTGEDRLPENPFSAGGLLRF